MGAHGFTNCNVVCSPPASFHIPNCSRIYLHQDAVGRARAILWHGMLGVAECSAFQFGTREVLEAVTSVHDSDEAREAGTSPVVILCGR